MATSTVSEHHETVEKNSTELLDRISMNSCPPSSFPDKFQDFFAALNEDSDDLPSMLEDKLIPRWISSFWTITWLSLRCKCKFLRSIHISEKRNNRRIYLWKIESLIYWIKMMMFYFIYFSFKFSFEHSQINCRWWF